MEKITLPDGSTWLSNGALTIGDYGGAGDVGLANLRVLKEEYAGRIEQYAAGEWRDAEEDGYALDFVTRDYRLIDVPRNLCPGADVDAVLVYYDYGGEQIFLRDSEAARETMRALDNYPCLDDEEVSRVEMEWEQEAWESWLRSDLVRTLDEEVQDKLDEYAPDEAEEILRESYHAAMEICNEYPTPEYSGVHVNVDRIAKTFGEQVLERIGKDA